MRAVTHKVVVLALVATTIGLNANIFAAGGVLAAGGTYWSCMGACCSGSAAGGLMASVMTGGVAGVFGAAACATVCSSLSAGQAVVVPGLCFDDNTAILQLESDGTTISRPVKSLRQGDRVATLDFHGELKWTKVISNERKSSEDTSRYVSIGAVNSNRKAFNLSITADHFMLRVVNAHERREELVMAADIKVGDTIYVYGDLDGRGMATVQSLQDISKEFRNLLATASGTVIANGILTSAMCDAGNNALPWALRKNASAAIEVWKHFHHHRLVGRD